jgi:hypothetical protein
MVRLAGTAVVVVIALMIAVPLVTKLASVLTVPAIIGTVLYVVVRLVNAHLNRW